jgi:hypothetical protein
MTDAEKRDKAIRGLEACVFNQCLMQCESCPYHTDKARCLTTLMRDALALLKGQEPRVLTLEELQAIETPWNRNTPPYLWVEERSAAGSRWTRWMSWGIIHDGVISQGTMGVQNYGQKWRVWNLQPTPEQMRETKWEDEDAE